MVCMFYCCVSFESSRAHTTVLFFPFLNSPVQPDGDAVLAQFIRQLNMPALSGNGKMNGIMYPSFCCRNTCTCLVVVHASKLDFPLFLSFFSKCALPKHPISRACSKKKIFSLITSKSLTTENRLEYVESLPRSKRSNLRFRTKALLLPTRKSLLGPVLQIYRPKASTRLSC